VDVPADLTRLARWLREKRIVAPATARVLEQMTKSRGPL
jgi:hypothetical protein